jgi:RHS repeat-associated protein
MHPYGEELGSGVGGRGSLYPPPAYPSITPDVISQKLTGKERDAETGLDYFGARYMSSAQGRFTSPDPAGPDLTNPQTLNKYRYALNNPLRYVDRNGLYEEDVHRGLTFALALAVGINENAAWRIAAADQWVDDSPATSPMHVAGGDQARALYHFTTPARRAELLAQFEGQRW